MTERAVSNAWLRRSWVFLGAADSTTFEHAWASEADALIACLEDNTPPQERARGRRLLARFVAGCRAAGKTACVRINPLAGEGHEDLAAVAPARPDAILLPKTESPAQVRDLAQAIEQHGLPATEIVPNIETALGLVQTVAIASSHPWVSACLLASEDLTTSLGAERGSDGIELVYARARFLVECRAADVVPIDCPYTFSDLAGLETETRHARRLGYPAKSTVEIDHAAVVNRVLTPSDAEVERARRIVEEFERARAQGRRAEVDGNYLEVPIALNARRLLERHALLTGSASGS